MSILRRPMPEMGPLRMENGDTLRKWQLTETWIFYFKHKKIIIPKGFIFDGASIPWVFRRIYNPVGYLLFAAIVHDFCFQKGFYQYKFGFRGEQLLFTETMTQKNSDDIFRGIANEVYPEHRIKTAFAYRALRWGGWIAWNKYRALDKRVV